MVLSRNAKFVVAILTGLGAWSTLVLLSPPGRIQPAEWVAGIGYLVTACIVWVTPNTNATPAEARMSAGYLSVPPSTPPAVVGEAVDTILPTEGAT